MRQPGNVESGTREVRYFWLFILLPLVAASQSIPQWQDFRVSTIWKGTNAPVKLARKDERMFRTRLTEAAKEPPDFAGHYRFVGWGCGSTCAAGALIDLQTGKVFPPPGRTGKETGWERWMFSGGIVDGNYLDVRPDSRLAIIRQDNQADHTRQEVQYYEWTGSGFKLLARRIENKFE